jgi:hypothetical protein
MVKVYTFLIKRDINLQHPQCIKSTSQQSLLFASLKIPAFLFQTIAS